jgi:ABC-type nitrate/sulfonate/bicarbonate transport system substrate-binding protein
MPQSAISRRTMLRTAGVIALGVPLASTLASCASSTSGSTSPTSTALSTNKINALKSFEADPAFTADFMALNLMTTDHKIDVNQQTLAGANTAITALIAGQVDIIVSSLPAGVAAIGSGQDLKAVFPGVMSPEHVILVNEKINGWSDVEGKTFGATSKTDSSYWELALLAEKHKIDVNKIKILTIRGGLPVRPPWSRARSTAPPSGSVFRSSSKRNTRSYTRLAFPGWSSRICCSTPTSCAGTSSRNTRMSFRRTPTRR